MPDVANDKSTGPSQQMLGGPQETWVCGCGLPMSKNPHPEAGDPGERGLEVGMVHVCIPCTQKALHGWAVRAQKAETALRKIEQPPSGTWRALYDRAQRIARETLS